MIVLRLWLVMAFSRGCLYLAKAQTNQCKVTGCMELWLQKLATLSVSAQKHLVKLFHHCNCRVEQVQLDAAMSWLHVAQGVGGKWW